MTLGAGVVETGSPVELFADPLCAEERPLSRYAGTVLVSPDGGLTFRELPQATHCRSCAQRERCLFLVEQFVATLLWNDDAGRACAPSPSVLGCLWKFIAERYTDELEGEAAHHFLSAVTKHGASNKLCRVFALTLSGALDGAAVRYASLLAEAAGCVTWGGVVDFYELASELYPFLQEEDLDELAMGFAAFSENSFTERLVLEFLLQRVIGNADPAFAEMLPRANSILRHEPRQDPLTWRCTHEWKGKRSWESRLAVHAGKGVGHMTVAELAGALEGSPLAGGEELWRHLMQQTAARLHSGNIPLQNVARILAADYNHAYTRRSLDKRSPEIMTYLSLLQEIPTLRGRFKQQHPGAGVEAERTVEGPSKTEEDCRHRLSPL
ncbi:unnamed protein product [Lampetra planeri]